MNNKKPYFPAVDRNFLSQIESLILSGQAFRLSRDYPAYLNKIKSAGINYIVVEGKGINYTETKPTEVRPESVIKIDDELIRLSEDFLELAEPDLEVIRSVTGSALEANGVKIKKGNRVSDNGFLKSEHLYY